MCLQIAVVQDRRPEMRGLAGGLVSIRRRCSIFIILAVLFGTLSRLKAEDERLEYQVKAAFLYNFLKFIDWPERRAAPWVVGVLGRDPLDGAVDAALRGKKAGGYEVVVRHFARWSDVQDCQLLFVPKNEFRSGAIPLHPGLLTVGEAPGFLDAGGVLNFIIEEDRVRFEISLESLRSAGLHASPQLLKLATIR